jgi:hypothetical protein
MRDRKIETSYQHPPVSWRNFDWAAWWDDLGADDSPYGYGATEQDAIDDLLDREDDDHA